MPPQPSIPLANSPWYIKAGAIVLLLGVALQVVKKIANRGSMGSVQSRGLVAEETSTRPSDTYFQNMMKNVNTTQYEELSEEQIQAARRRRSQDRRNDQRIDLSKIELPANHPFAVNKQISKEEEELQKARLSVRRGMPIKSMDDLERSRRRGMLAPGPQQQQQQPQDRRGLMAPGPQQQQPQDKMGSAAEKRRQERR